MNVGELFVSLGFDVDLSSLTEFNAGITEARNDILKMSAAAVGAVYAVNALFSSTAQQSLELKNFTDQTGYSADALQKWQAVVHQTNPAMGLEEAAAGYKKLAQTLIDIRQGKGDSGALAMLGVTYDTNMTPDKALEQIRQHLQESIAQNGIGFVSDKLNAIGVGAGYINALKLSNQQFSELAQNSMISQEAIDANVRYAETIAKIDVEWQKFKMNFTAEWADDLVSGIQKADIALGEFYRNISAVAKWIADADKEAHEFFVILEVLAGVWAIATFPITAAFIALAVAINDVGKAIRGLPSFTADFIEMEKRGLYLLKNDPDQFLTNLDNNIANLMGGNKAQSGAAPSRSITQNVTNHIHGTSDPRVTAEEVNRVIQNNINSAYATTNLGANY